MKVPFLLSTMALLAAANTMNKAELYASGAIMSRLMSHKQESFDRQRALGRYETTQYPDITSQVPCLDGKATAIPGNANYTFACSNVDLYSFRSHASLGSTTGQRSSSWGWTSASGREFVCIGQKDGASFAEIKSDGSLVYLGRLPPFSVNSLWREIRGFKDYMIIGSEAKGHGIQIFDMKKLLEIDPTKPVTFDKEKDLTGHFGGLPVGSTHNVVVNEETGYIYSVGAVPRKTGCAAGPIFIDMADPTKPTQVGCAAQEGYTHDAQCVVYRGPHTKYVGKEICYGYNEDKLVM
jgi:choice-of-anchor B domain-containing protein